MTKRELIASLILSVLAFPATRLAGGPLPQASGQKVPVKAQVSNKPLVAATESPVIVEFAVIPEMVIEGDRSAFHWRVEPGRSGSPIESLEIFNGTPEAPLGRAYARLLLSGEYPTPPVVTGGRGRVSYTLRIVDHAGRSASRTVVIRTGTLDSLLAGLTGFTLNLETTVDGARRDNIATIGFDNGSGITGGSLIVYLYQAYSPLMLSVDIPAGYLAGESRYMGLVGGHNEFRVGVSLRPTAPAAGDPRGLDKLVMLIVKEQSPGVIERILVRGIYELVETRDAAGSRYSVRLIRVG